MFQKDNEFNPNEATNQKERNSEKPKKRNDRNFANGLLFKFFKNILYKTEKEL